VQEVFFIEKRDKDRFLQNLLDRYNGPVLVFTRTKHGARKLSRNLRKVGHAAAEMHSDRSQGQRRDALEGFKLGKYRILVATDIAARGIDVVGIEVVINYDLPNHTQDYVHRIGRTARAGLGGRAISFATFDQRQDVRDIERLIKTGLSIKQVTSARANESPDQMQEREIVRATVKKDPRPFGRTSNRKSTRNRRRR
jgi:ATP-dependent RNA helicase RhlE